MSDIYNDINLIHYEGQFGSFDYDPAEVEPILDEDKALEYDEESGATMELWDYDPIDTLEAAHKDPTHYDFLIRDWDFCGMVPEGFRYPSMDFDFMSHIIDWDINIDM